LTRVVYVDTEAVPYIEDISIGARSPVDVQYTLTSTVQIHTTFTPSQTPKS